MDFYDGLGILLEHDFFWNTDLTDWARIFACGDWILEHGFDGLDTDLFMRPKSVQQGFKR